MTDLNTDLNKIDQSKCFICNKCIIKDDLSFDFHSCINNQVIKIIKFDNSIYHPRKLFIHGTNLIFDFNIYKYNYYFDSFQIFLVYNELEGYNKMYLNFNNNNIIQLDQKDFVEFYDNLRTCFNYIKKYVENIMFI